MTRKQRLTLQADRGNVCVFVNPGPADNCLAEVTQEEACRRILSQPELLAACKAILGLQTEEPSPAWDLIREAIAKAEGRS